MWDLPGAGLEPMSPALAGRFLTTAPPGKPILFVFKESASLLVLGFQFLFVTHLGYSNFLQHGLRYRTEKEGIKLSSTLLKCSQEFCKVDFINSVFTDDS